MDAAFPKLPQSWSELTWQQLTDCWQAKIRYGHNPDVARPAALLSLLQLQVLPAHASLRRPSSVVRCPLSILRSPLSVVCCPPSPTTGEHPYLLRPSTQPSPSAPSLYITTPRELSQIAKQAIPWFDYPYGDPGEKEQRDDKGKVVKEARKGVRGYVSEMHDAMILPKEEIKVGFRHFYLPQMAMNNLTWQQYRSLQAIAPQLFAEGITNEQALDLQAQFLAHCLVPRSIALLDTTGGSIRLRPHYEYRYNTEQAEGLAKWWKKKLSTIDHQISTLFHICFQCYQTAIGYYATTYPLLFSSESKGDIANDALKGEVGTINSIMKYQGYSDPQQVYDTNLPIILDTLNTMAKEAKEIERMNAKIKRK